MLCFGYNGLRTPVAWDSGESRMSEHVTIELSEQVARRAESVARLSHRRVEDVLAELLERAVEELPVDMLPDEDVIALAGMTLDKDRDDELSGLLTRNREAALDDEAKRRLDELMGVYERGLLRKAQALREAVRRGLLEPLVA